MIEFIFKKESNKWYAIFAIIGSILQLTIFKYLYPFASFINGDSYSYLETAYHNLPINTYPIGYSMFLRFFSIFTKSDTILVAFQYFLVQLSLQAFIFTLFHYYKPSPITKISLFTFTLFNPAILYLSNYISSDAFFLALSIIWFTQLFWIINAPSKRLIFINAIILFVAFTVRYNALFYPIIAIIAIFQGKQKTGLKIGGLSLSFLLIGAFILYNIDQYNKLTGHRQFTPFTGWQTANNALYAYRFVDSAHLKKVPVRFFQLDKMVRNYFDSTKDYKKHPQETLIASTVYMWAPNSPLNLYMERQFKKDSGTNALKKWATVAPFLSEYGSVIIRYYPKEYLKYYIIPNIIKYYAPPIEFLSQYSTGVDSVSPIASVWFNYKTNKLKTRVKDYKVEILNFYPILTGTMNIVLLFCLLSFFLLKGVVKSPRLKHGMLLVIALWIVNFGFSVIAAPIALRFQLFPILVSFSFTFFLLEFLIKSAFESESINNGAPEEINRIKNDSVIV
ncbi:hypothetical protein [Chitinophaga sp.]|uniref:hypothetical protein n=1 Tax=Chitinophaga sp. TaxID=1869181 RepID=UPI002F91DCDA